MRALAKLDRDATLADAMVIAHKAVDVDKGALHVAVTGDAQDCLLQRDDVDARLHVFKFSRLRRVPAAGSSKRSRRTCVRESLPHRTSQIGENVKRYEDILPYSRLHVNAPRLAVNCASVQISRRSSSAVISTLCCGQSNAYALYVVENAIPQDCVRISVRFQQSRCRPIVNLLAPERGFELRRRASRTGEKEVNARKRGAAKKGLRGNLLTMPASVCRRARD